MSVWLDGIGLDSLNSTIRVKGILIGAVDTTEIISANAKYSGVRYLGQMENTRQVRVTFKVLDATPARREQVLAEVLEWALGTQLEVIHRPDQYLNVRCTDYPSLELIRDYAGKDIVIGFTAFDPDFKAKYPTIVSLATAAGVTASASIAPPGTQAITFLEAEIRNDGATTMNTASISVNGRTFAFTGLGLAAGKTLIIARNAQCRLTMAIDGLSVLDKRTAASDDDLILMQRVPNTVSVLNANACAVKLIARGQYR